MQGEYDNIAKRREGRSRFQVKAGLGTVMRRVRVAVRFTESAISIRAVHRLLSAPVETTCLVSRLVRVYFGGHWKALPPAASGA